MGEEEPIESTLKFCVFSIQMDSKHVCTAINIYEKKHSETYLVTTAMCGEKILPFIEQRNLKESKMVRACNGHVLNHISLCPPVTRVRKASGYVSDCMNIHKGPYTENNLAIIEVSLY